MKSLDEGCKTMFVSANKAAETKDKIILENSFGRPRGS